MLMETMNSVRTYTGERVKPELVEQQSRQDKFIAETVSVFVATSAFTTFSEATK